MWMKLKLTFVSPHSHTHTCTHWPFRKWSSESFHILSLFIEALNNDRGGNQLFVQVFDILQPHKSPSPTINPKKKKYQNNKTPQNGGEKKKKH